MYMVKGKAGIEVFDLFSRAMARCLEACLDPFSDYIYLYKTFLTLTDAY
jgi:hypothetical protein